MRFFLDTLEDERACCYRSEVLSAFAEGDAEKMVACYHDEIQFEDPIFGLLRGNDAKKMWRMLVRPGIQITFSDVIADEDTGSATWIAEYTFGKSQRPVFNKIRAQFQFKDGKIIRHTDHFNFWKWTRQALGLQGLLFGWTPWMQRKLRTKVRTRLTAFMGEPVLKNI